MPDQIERWSEELARNPGSRVFLPLADALRQRGQTELALRIAWRGLSRRPEDPDAHDLVARIWADRGDLQQAMDEWSAALRFDPNHIGSLKGMGFACYQMGQLTEARDHLTQALAGAPEDASIRTALERIELAAPLPRVTASGRNQPAASAAISQRSPDSAFVGGRMVETGDPPAAILGTTDPRLLFADLLGDEQAALLVDAEGLVLAGAYVVAEGHDVGSDVAAALSGVSAEATRAMRHLGLGAWTSLVIETGAATVAISPITTAHDVARSNGDAHGSGRWRSVASDGITLVAAGQSIPLGLVRRLLARVVERGRTWLAGDRGAAS